MTETSALGTIDGCCHNAKELLHVGLHWHVPFIEDLSETVQVLDSPDGPGWGSAGCCFGN